MATESSAVVRFINLVQKDHAPIFSEGIRETAVDLRPHVGKSTKIAFGAALIAGAAIAGGFWLGRGHFGSSSSSSSAASSTPGSAPVAGVTPGALPTPAAAPTPPPIPAPVVAPIVSVPPEALADTGFDIRVSPPGKVTVDAQVLGTAPLRVRNLQPGKHVIEVEAPAGYFSRRLEVDLVAGEPQELKLELDAIEDDAAVAAEQPRAGKDSEKKVSRAASKRAARAEKLAAAAEAKRLASERAELKREAARDERERRAREAKATKVAKADRQPAAEDDLDAAMASVTGDDAPKKSAPKVAALAPSGDAGGGEPGTLMLGSKPLCDIYIDGKATGLKTPQRSMELAPGTYKIKLINAELGIDKSFKVKIAPGKTTRAIQDLTK